MTDTQQRLKSLIERIERLTEEKQAIATDIKEVYAEAKATGYDVKIMRMIVKLRKLRGDERAEKQALLETYASAIGLDHVYFE